MKQQLFFTSVLLTLLVFPNILLSQSGRLCGTDDAYKEALTLNPELSQKRAALEEFTKEFAKYPSDRAAGIVKIIPVVFHIIHNYGVENISKAQVEDALRIINEDFRKLAPDTTDIIPAFQGIAADSEVDFRLARIDPNGNCTEGITRTASKLTFDAGENVKDLISWDNAKYLNVWVVANISSGAGAYAYYPGTAQPGNEGIVNLNTQFGSIGTSCGNNFCNRTLTHEIGHYFNLAHPWGSSNNVNQPTACFIDDWVDDTPNTVGSPQNCDLNRNTCFSLDNVQNFMDYSTCSKMFTQGQSQRMDAALNSTIGYRYYLWQPSNLLATGTNDGYSDNCAPIADFNADAYSACEGDVINFTDYSYNADLDSTWSWLWSFPGGTPSSSAAQNPSITYNTPGIYNVSLTATNTYGNNTLTKNVYITIKSIDGRTAPLFESMEDASFPAHPNDPNKDWLIENTSPITWERTTIAAFTGYASMRIDNAEIQNGSINSLITPVVDMSNISVANAKVTFRMAYVRKNNSSNDRLRVYASSNCGKTWAIRYARTGSTLATNGGGYVSGEFIPDSAEWREESANLSSYAGQSEVMLKFEMLTEKGNFLYLDDINIGEYVIGNGELVANKPTIKIYPSPVVAGSILSYELLTGSEVTLEVLDILGRSVLVTEQGWQYGKHTYILQELTGNLDPGVYFIRLSTDKESVIKRFAVAVK